MITETLLYTRYHVTQHEEVYGRNSFARVGENGVTEIDPTDDGAVIYYADGSEYYVPGSQILAYRTDVTDE